MNDNTFTPTETGVYVNRVYQDGRDAPASTNTVKIAHDLTALAEQTGVPIHELRRWWYETHSERLFVV